MVNYIKDQEVIKTEWKKSKYLNLENCENVTSLYCMVYFVSGNYIRWYVKIISIYNNINGACSA